MIKKHKDKLDLLEKNTKHLKARQTFGDDNIDNYNVISYSELYNQAKQGTDDGLYAIKLAYDQRFNILSQSKLRLSTYTGKGTYEFPSSVEEIISSDESYSFGHVLIVNVSTKDNNDYFVQNTFGAIVA
jgi:hypothetical protein